MQQTPTPNRQHRGAATSGKPEDALAMRRRRVADGASAPVLPDCCNLGIVLRVVLLLGVGSTVGALLDAASAAGAAVRLLQILVVVVPVTVLGLGLLCMLRSRVNGMSQRAQWAVAIGVPSALTLLVAAVAEPWASDGQADPGYWVLTRTLAAGVVALGIAVYFRLRARAFSPSLSEARLQALQARIRPHFLFNSLNTVLGLMRGEPRKAEVTLENLSELFRVFMRDTRELVPLQDEVDTCRHYLDIEQLRLGERLQVRWQVDDAPGDALLPSLLLQPLIENAVHHGIEPNVEPGEILIEISLEGDRVRVLLSNPLPGDQPDRAGNQMALSNVRERLTLLYDMEAELDAGPKDGRFQLKLEFPYRKERRRRDVKPYLNIDR